jgi:tRNA 2-selenouridine synthase
MSSTELGPKIEAAFFRDLVINRTPLIDVRAPVEYGDGHLPFSVNLPILNNDERKAVGTLYKTDGPAAAEALGHQLVSGDVKKNRILAWQDFTSKNPGPILTCFRGGLRSQISQGWLREKGTPLPRIDGGYKAMRQFYLTQLLEHCQHPWHVVAGATGAGKTILLRDLIKAHCPVIDLEGLAMHRGSAFGHMLQAQPSQATFENHLSASMIQLSQIDLHTPWLIEDESRMIGSVSLPGPLFEALATSPILLIEESLAVRTENTFDEYVRQTALGTGDVEKGITQLDLYLLAVGRISKKLGGLRTDEVLKSLHDCKVQLRQFHEIDCNREWIELLLRYYYDPLYEKALKARQAQVLFRGRRAEVQAYVASLKTQR